MATEPGPRSNRTLVSLQRLAVEIDGWLDLGDAEQALSLLDPLLDNPATRLEARVLQCRAWIELDRFEDALRLLAHFDPTTLEPEWLFVTRAWCHKRLDDLPAAIQCMHDLLDSQPASAIGHYNLGCYLALDSAPDAALESLATAFALDPAFLEHAVDESDLDSLRVDPRFDELLRPRT